MMIMVNSNKREGKQKELDKISKAIRERNTRAPILKATVTCIKTGVTTILDTQNDIVQAAAESNCRCQCKSEVTAFRTAPLLQEFGYCADNKVNVDAILDRMYMIPPVTEKYAKEFIAALEMPTSIWCKEKNTLFVSPEEHKSAWKKQKASTACESTALSHEH